MDADLALLRTIIDNPDDDVPRLVYADWLEDHGQTERAEFIRAQVEMAHLLREGQDVPQAIRLRSRQTELLARHEREWFREFRTFARSWTFDRGFIGYVSMEARDFADHADFLFENTPLQRLRLARLGKHLPEVIASPYLRRLTHLYLHEPAGARVDLLLEGAMLEGLIFLDLFQWSLSIEEREQLRARFGNRVQF